MADIEIMVKRRFKTWTEFDDFMVDMDVITQVQIIDGMAIDQLREFLKWLYSTDR